MLTNCGCIADAEQTKILRPCLLHALWAKEYAATVFSERVAQADAKAGKGTAPRANLKAPWEAPR